MLCYHSSNGSLRQSSTSGNLGAATLAQSIAETELVARDGETVVIGGLTRESSEQVRTGIPILSEIPILGWLFGSTEDRDVKRNLLFFVTPHVIRDPSDMRAILERRLRERRELLERAMAFDDEWEPPIDYRRTRGLVGEMLRGAHLAARGRAGVRYRARALAGARHRAALRCLHLRDTLDVASGLTARPTSVLAVPLIALEGGAGVRLLPELELRGYVGAEAWLAPPSHQVVGGESRTPWPVQPTFELQLRLATR